MADMKAFLFLILYLSLSSMLIGLIVSDMTGMSIGGFNFIGRISNTSYDFTANTSTGDIPIGRSESGKWSISASGLSCNSLNLFGDADYFFLGGGVDDRGIISTTYYISNPNNGEFGIWLFHSHDRQIIVEFYDTGVEVHDIEFFLLPDDKIIARSGFDYTSLDSLTIKTEVDTKNLLIRVMVDSGMVINIKYDELEFYQNDIFHTTADYSGIRSHIGGLLIEKIESSSELQPDYIGGSSVEDTGFSWVLFVKSIMAVLSWGITDPVLLQLVPFPILFIFIGIPEIGLAFTVVQIIRGN